MLAFILIKPVTNLNFNVMKKYFIIILTVVFTLFYSCAGDQDYFPDDLDSNFAAQVKTEAYEEATETEMVEDAVAPPTEIAIPSRSIERIERKLIKEGNITFETDDCQETKKIIHQVAHGLKGYLARDDEYTNDYQIQHNITIRIPSENFDKLLVQISKSVEDLDNQNITVKDVTEEYVDVKARLKAKKLVEKRYLELLNKAYSVGDILQVENELARLREQIESTEGRLRYLQDQASLSTLHINFYQNLEVKDSNFEFFSKMADGFNNGFIGLLWFFIGITNVWPILLFMGIVTWLIIRLIKKTSVKKK